MTDPAARPSKGQRRRQVIGAVVMAAGAGLWGLGIASGFAEAHGAIPEVPYLRRVPVWLGTGLVSLGAALFKGKPIPDLETRPTSAVIIVLALVLFGVVLLGAGLAMADNFTNGAGGRRWAVTTGFTLAAVLVVYALLRDLFSRFERRTPPG